MLTAPLTNAPASYPLERAMRVSRAITAGRGLGSRVKLRLGQALVGLGVIAGQACRTQARDSWVLASDPRVEIMGRVDRSRPDRIRIGYPGVTFRVRFDGPSLRVRVACSTDQSHVSVLVDGGAPRVLRLPKGVGEVSLADGLGAGEHSLELVHRTETWQGVISVLGFLPAAGARVLPAEPWPTRRLLFIGDSVTCGEAIDRGPTCAKDSSWWNAYLSYGMVLSRALHAQCQLVCYGGRGLVRDWQGKSDVLNAPQFFDLALPDESRPKWEHASYQPDVILVSLGTNDFNLGSGEFPERQTFVSSYVAFVHALRAQYPLAHIVLTEGAIVSDAERPQKSVLRAYIAETAQRLGDARVQGRASQPLPG